MTITSSNILQSQTNLPLHGHSASDDPKLHETWQRPYLACPQENSFRLGALFSVPGLPNLLAGLEKEVTGLQPHFADHYPRQILL